jgi:hypothetical protein
MRKSDTSDWSVRRHFRRANLCCSVIVTLGIPVGVVWHHYGVPMRQAWLLSFCIIIAGALLDLLVFIAERYAIGKPTIQRTSISGILTTCHYAWIVSLIFPGIGFSVIILTYRTDEDLFRFGRRLFVVGTVAYFTALLLKNCVAYFYKR